jgi:hypothetical protein
MKVSQWRRAKQGEDNSLALIVITLLLIFGIYRLMGMFAVETTLRGEAETETQLINATMNMTL